MSPARRPDVYKGLGGGYVIAGVGAALGIALALAASWSAAIVGWEVFDVALIAYGLRSARVQLRFSDQELCLVNLWRTMRIPIASVEQFQLDLRGSPRRRKIVLETVDGRLIPIEVLTPWNRTAQGNESELMGLVAELTRELAHRKRALNG